MLKLGVTGTDTGVGKTTVAAALLAALRDRHGGRVSAMKPIETGVTPGSGAADASALRAAAGGLDAAADVCPVALEAPLAPLEAARLQARRIDLGRLDHAFDRLCRGRSAIVVEGAGGLLTPITPTLAYDGLFRRWRLDLIVVAANRLGALNHSLLTVGAARAAGLRVRALVLNDAVPGTDLAARTNQNVLASVLRGVPIVPFPHLDEARPGRTPHHAAAVLLRALGVRALCREVA